MFAKFDDIIMKNILQFYPIVNFNEARVKKTKVVEVFFNLLVSES